MGNQQLPSVVENQLALIGDDTPVTGGVELPPHLLASPTDTDDCVLNNDDLGRHLYWLLKLHPDAISPKLNPSHLPTMDDDAKRRFILEIQNTLGIAPLTGDVL